jgi:hypothetical protein
MCIWNKILVGLIGVASLVLFYMTARALKTETYWSELAQKHAKRIKELSDENVLLAEGNNQQPGIRQLRLDLQKLLVDRRRTWWNCDPRVKPGADGRTAEVTIAMPQPKHGIAKKQVLYAFEEADVQNKGPNKGQYVGEFSVTNTGDRQLTLVPTGRLSPREMEKLKKTKRPWALYEILPRDNHEIFASLTDEQKKAMLPADSVQEYLKDGKPSVKDDPADRVVGGKYVRPLVDYVVALTDARDHRVTLTNSVAAVEKDKQLVEKALSEARAQEEACKSDIASTDVKLKKMARDRDIVVAIDEKLQKSIEAMQAWIDRLAKTNRDMAGQIAKYQLEAARRIDERTRVMAQSGAGRL